MMNRVDLIGRLTRDPELRRSANGNSVLRFSLAVDRRIKQPGGPEADFISCVAFGKTADNMARFLHKGSLIAVEGSIQTGSYVNQQGAKVYTTDIIANHVQFLESKKASQGYEASNNAYGTQSYGGTNYQNQGYNGYQGYGSDQPYGGYQDSYQSSGYSSQQNPYAQSVDNGFTTPAPAKPARPAATPSYGSADESEDMSDLFDNSQTLDISSDDLPF